MNNHELKKIAIKASVFALVSLSLMIHRSATKHIMISDAQGTGLDRGSAEDSFTLLFDKNVPSGKENILIIPLSQSVSSDNIVLEDDYVDHELRIYVDSREEGFYMDTPVVTDLDIIESGTCTPQSREGSSCLEFKLDGLYANESTLTENSSIEISFFDPREKFDKVVVVDPAGDAVEKDITVDTALLIKKLADRDEENDIRIYFTSLSDTPVSPEKKRDLIEESGADLYIQLSADTSEDPSREGMSAYYNDVFFLRKLSNSETADIILRNTATKAESSAAGIFPMLEEDEMLRDCKIPSARIDLGNRASEKDSERLLNEAFRKRIAEGLYSGIVEAFEVMR